MQGRSVLLDERLWNRQERSSLQKADIFWRAWARHGHAMRSVLPEGLPAGCADASRRPGTVLFYFILLSSIQYVHVHVFVLLHLCNLCFFSSAFSTLSAIWGLSIQSPLPFIAIKLPSLLRMRACALCMCAFRRKSSQSLLPPLPLFLLLSRFGTGPEGATGGSLSVARFLSHPSLTG